MTAICFLLTETQASKLWDCGTNRLTKVLIFNILLSELKIFLYVTESKIKQVQTLTIRPIVLRTEQPRIMNVLWITQLSHMILSVRPIIRWISRILEHFSCLSWIKFTDYERMCNECWNIINALWEPCRAITGGN